MKTTIYDFDLRRNQLKHEHNGEVINSRDYFQWYTTGIESVVFHTKNDYFLTSRYENERSEVIMYNFFDKEHISDVLLAVNNDVYLWDAPFNYDTQEIVIQNKINIIEHNRKQSLTPGANGSRKYYHDKFTEELEAQNVVQRNIIVPRYNKLQKVIRNLKRFLDNRKVF